MTQTQEVMHTITAWDIGGANLKAAMIDEAGNLLQVVQVPCPLWRGLDVLALAIDEVLTKFSLVKSSTHAITMTGELADIFSDRHDGVMQIAQLIEAKLSYAYIGEQTYYFSGAAGLVKFEQVAQHTAQIASANWLASAFYVAAEYHQALLVDMGSTTTDLIVIADAKPQLNGLTDAARLKSSELVYTGMIRTPLMAVAQRIVFAGEFTHIAAEHFATMADVYRLTGYLDESEDMSDTADGKGKTLTDSARRLARMVGHDVQDADLNAWKNLAQAFKQAQIDILKQAALRQISRGLLDPFAPIVGAGVGSHVVRELAQQLNRKFQDVTAIISADSNADKGWACVCFPAYALAKLALQKIKRI